MDARKKGPMEGHSVCKHSCAHHEELMDPVHWSTLPSEVLHMILACLPLTSIISLQCLSKKFSQPEFMQLCASVDPNPKLFAMVAEDDWNSGSIALSLFDTRSNKWHIFNVKTPHWHFFEAMNASDGGLVCFISKEKDKVEEPLVIIVVSPLTRQWKRLPLHPSLSKIQPVMVRLVMNRNTKCYKLLVVAKEKHHSGDEFTFGKVYDSASGERSDTNCMSDLFFGYRFQWRYEEFDEESGAEDEHKCKQWRVPCIFSCPETQLFDLREPFFEGKPRVLVDGHLFVLEEETYEWESCMENNPVEDTSYIISEYEGHKSSPHWTRLRVHACRDFASPPVTRKFRMTIDACKGFRLASARSNDNHDFDPVHQWLYDLSTCEWEDQELPPHPDGDFDSFGCAREMCELQWDAVP